MDDALTVRDLQTREHRIHNVDSLLNGEAVVVVQEITQRNAGYVLHDDIGQVAVFALVVNIDQVGVRQACGSSRLTDKTNAECVVCG